MQRNIKINTLRIMKTRYEKHQDQGVMWTVEFYFKEETGRPGHLLHQQDHDTVLLEM